MQTKQDRLKYLRGYFKIRRDILKSAGMCLNCTKRRSETGKTCCKKCLTDKRINNLIRRNPKSPLVFKQELEAFRKLKRQRKGVCPICSKKKKRLQVDHCHETGKIRGLLCNNCNKGIAYFKDNKTSLKNAIKYLQ